MPLPVLLAVDQDQDALEDVETQLVQRYAHEYRVECLGDPEGAVRMLTDLARAGEEVALVLMGISDTTGGELLERVRQLHPHAKRALLVPSGAWTDQPTAEAILDSMALGRTTTTCSGRRPRRMRCSTRPSRVSCSSGRRTGASFRTPSTSLARSGRAGPTS